MRLSEQPLITAEAIARHVEALAAQINRDYAGKSVHLIAVLKGATLFAADLMRKLDIETTLCFVRAKSYGGGRSTGEIRFTHLPEDPLQGRHVLVIEDILDTGLTAEAILRRIEAERPASLAVCTLLDKPARRVAEVHAKYVGVAIEDNFVVGYGLDYNERYRQLPAIYTLEEE